MSSGEMTGGERTGGEMTGGERTGGERTGGEMTGGERTGGERTGGERRRADRAARHWAIGLFLAFAGLAALVALRWPPMVDRDLAVDVAAHALVLREKLLLTAAIIVTNAGSPVSVNVITALVSGWLLYRRRAGAAAYLIAARLVELGVETAVKHLIGRPRPALPDPVGQASSFSFPSGHTAGTAVLCTALLVVAFTAGTALSGSGSAPAGSGPVGRRRHAVWIVPAGAAIVGVAASRVLLGVHYPSDVLGGALLGVACALLLVPLPDLVDRRLTATPDRAGVPDPRDADPLDPPPHP